MAASILPADEYIVGRRCLQPAMSEFFSGMRYKSMFSFAVNGAGLPNLTLSATSDLYDRA